MKSTANAVRREKWFDRLSFNDGDEAFRAHWRKSFSQGLPPTFDCPEKPKSYSDIGVWCLGLEALNRVLAKLDLPGVSAASSRMHILEDEVFTACLGSDLLGRCDCGHVFLRDRLDRIGQMAVLAHELVHLAARFDIRLAPTEKGARIEGVRNGYMRSSRGRRETPLFLGLNEAATEMIACRVRRQLLEVVVCDGPQRDVMTEMRAYAAQILVVVETAKRVGELAGIGAKDAGLLFCRGYFTGSDAFLRLVRLHDPAAYAALRDMGKNPADARLAAERLGYETVLARLAAPAAGAPVAT